MTKLKDGKYTVRFRQHLREFIESKENLVTYLNDLIELEYKDSLRGAPNQKER